MFVMYSSIVCEPLSLPVSFVRIFVESLGHGFLTYYSTTLEIYKSLIYIFNIYSEFPTYNVD